MADKKNELRNIDFGLLYFTNEEKNECERVIEAYNNSKKPEGELGVLAPNKKYIRFTAFVEPDEVFNKYGIYTLDDLKTFAEKWYGSEEKGNNRNPKNALYKFVAYHFVEGELPYNRIVYSRSGSNEDIYDKIFILIKKQADDAERTLYVYFRH